MIMEPTSMWRVEIFREAHPETSELYDVKHKAACLLKARLEKDPRWKAYTSQLAYTKFALQQTALACLTPPSQRSKARFMNVDELVDWGIETLALVDDPSRLAKLGISAEQMKAKLSWLKEFRAALADWSACTAVIAKTLDFIRCRGLTACAGQGGEPTLPTASGCAGELREQLLGFVVDESSKVRQGERLPGTTEVLESCFGKLKDLEDGQSKSGFTGLVLSLGAMVSKWTAESVSEEAWAVSEFGTFWTGVKENLGPNPGPIPAKTGLRHNTKHARQSDKCLTLVKIKTFTAPGRGSARAGHAPARVSARSGRRSSA